MKLWGGNYSAGPDRQFWEFNRSFPFDQRLLSQEIAASRAYARALGRCSAIPEKDAAALDAGLAQVLSRAQQDPTYLDTDAEDVHSFVEARLGEIVGELAGQGHLGRSRNEQAVTALRLWIRDAIDGLGAALRELVLAWADQGEKGAELVMPGYTHIRAAEPISFGHFAACHAWGLVRDRERLHDARRRVNVLPLGSGALAGTALPIDREALARELGFEALSPSALDAVSDRDFAVEFVSGCALVQTHLSRIAEDLIWLSGPEFGLFELPEAYTTGSSLMPQKKNPDSLELIRGKAARVDSDLLRLLLLLKGLPAGYQKDLQEDKEAVFEAADTTALSLTVVTGVVRGLQPRADAMRLAAGREDMMAAGLAVALAREGMPFRNAHALVGSLVAAAPQHGGSLRAAAAAALPSVSPKVAARLGEIFDPAAAIRAKAATGGTAPDAVRASLLAARERVRRE